MSSNSDSENSPKIILKVKEKKNRDKNMKKRKAFNSDEDDSDYVPGEDDLDNEVDEETYQQFLFSLFPSKHLKNKISNTKEIKSKKTKAFSKLKNNSKKKNKSQESDKGNKNKKISGTKKKRKKVVKKSSRKKTGNEIENDENNESDESDDEEGIFANGKQAKFNIIYSFGDDDDSDLDDNDYETDYDMSESDTNTEDEEEYNEILKKKVDEATDEDWEKVLIMDEKKMKQKEKARKEMIKSLKKNDRVKVKEKHWSKKYIGTIKKIINKKIGRKIKKLYTIQLDNKKYRMLKNVTSDVILEKVTKKSSSKLNSSLKELLVLKNKDENEFIKRIEKYQEEFTEELETLQEEKEKKLKVKNLTRFKKLLKDKDKTNDIGYFKNMKLVEQRNILKNLVEINKVNNVDKPYKIRLLESPIDSKIKSIALKKVNLLTMMDPYSGDYYKNKLWVDTFMTIPFGVHSKLPVNIDDGLDKCQEFMKSAKTQLDNVVYGLNDAKMQIMQMVGSWISNPDAIGTAIAIHGPMGTGKTTLVKEGISKILNRPFAFIPLGGATDSSYLEGHSYTYEGSLWGKIVDVLIHSKSMNPVFYFDELDKVSNTPKGEEIIGILTHLTDTTQNSQYHDKYFSNLDFDLSKALFIFSYNEENKVNSILRDRMYRIKTAGYTSTDKLTISRNHLIPKIEKNLNFKKGDVVFEDSIIDFIIKNYTMEEKGVRNLKRCYEIIFTKLNLYRLMQKDKTLFEEKEYIEVEFPFTITTEHLNKLIKEKDKNNIPFGMYI